MNIVTHHPNPSDCWQVTGRWHRHWWESPVGQTERSCPRSQESHLCALPSPQIDIDSENSHVLLESNLPKPYLAGSMLIWGTVCTCIYDSSLFECPTCKWARFGGSSGALLRFSTPPRITLAQHPSDNQAQPGPVFGSNASLACRAWIKQHTATTWKPLLGCKCCNFAAPTKEEATSPCFTSETKPFDFRLHSFWRHKRRKDFPTVNCYFFRCNACCPMLARAQKSHQHWNPPAPLMTAAVTRHVATSKSPCAKKSMRLREIGWRVKDGKGQS